MTAILGLSAFYHDSAAALVVDGRVVAAAQEERFTRKKHDSAFPEHAVRYCLDHAGLAPDQLDFVGFYDKPFLKFDRLLETYLAFAPAGFRSFSRAMPLWLGEKLHLPRIMKRALGGAFRKRFVFAEHHESHAASAFFPSPFEDAAIMTLDGVGEWATATFGHGRGNEISLTHQLRFPHSLGLLYSAFTYFTGFRVNSGEYKLMGLAPYGEPRYVDIIVENLLDLRPDGSFRLDLSYFNYCQGLTMTSPKMDALFGRGPRDPDSEPTEQDMDIAASIQKVTEDIVLRIARHVRRKTGMRNLVMAGGVALNSVANGRILREGPFDDVWIQPAAGDSGAALGVAMLIWHQLLGSPRVPASPDAQAGSLLGPEFTAAEVRRALDEAGATYEECPDEAGLCDRVARAIADGKVVGWMQGRMEFGPRALGTRSILGDARDPGMQRRMNVKIKFRESFRPFAPSVLVEDCPEYFELDAGHESPYMLLVAPVAAPRRTPGDANAREGLDRVHEIRSDVPAITHVDYSARVQTVDPARNPRYYRLISRFREITGSSVIVNTSFNVRGEPIVCTPDDAYRCFMGTDMDVLAIGNLVLRKEDQRDAGNAHPDTPYAGRFRMD